VPARRAGPVAHRQRGVGAARLSDPASLPLLRLRPRPRWRWRLAALVLWFAAFVALRVWIYDGNMRMFALNLPLAFVFFTNLGAVAADARARRPDALPRALAIALVLAWGLADIL